MREKILKHPLVSNLEQLRDDSGRSEGWQATLIPGYNWEGCSFVKGFTLRDMLKNLDEITEGDPY
jgi:hypothetical protein